MTKFLLLSFLAGSMAVLPLSAQRKAQLVVTASTKYQHIDGFGGTGMNGQWADVYTQQKVNMLWGQGDDQIGLNIMRIRINPNEGNWGEYGNAIKWARAVNPNLQVFATPWTPPKKYKTSKTTIYKNDFGTDVWPLVDHPWGGQGSNGGAINPDFIEDFADFLERYRATMERKGCPIDMISIQNESNYTPTATDDGVEHASYESCIYSPKEMAATVKAARAKVNAKCKIMGPETFGWGQSPYNTTLANMPDAVNSIDVWGNHIYGSMKTNQWGPNDYDYISTVTKKTGKSMWMTEFLIDYDKNTYKGDMSAEKDMIESIEYCLTHGYNAYVYYNMLDDFFACNHGGSDTELWKRAYIFGHYAKYATGKTRVKSALTDNNGGLIGGSSYINAAGDTLTCFVYNPTSSVYTFTVSVPFIPTNIKQIATGNSVNRIVTDITEEVNCTTKFPKLTLQPGIFYTFQFVNAPDAEEEAAELARSPKDDSYASPINPMQYMADPTGVEYDGRLYIYATNDQQEFDASHGLLANSYGKINQLVCFSTADMVNWTNHGVIDVKAIAPWIYASWAPSVISREEAGGKTHFYMYFTNSASGIGVLTATSPLGPWTDPLGKALIDSKTPGLGTIGNIIDPGAAINPETGEAYLTFGGGDIKGTGTDLHPGNARIVKLGDDLISLGSEIKTIDAPCQFEANELNFIGGKWVYSYCTRWTVPSNWSSYSTSIAAPSACSIVYMVNSGDPLTDKWSYKGVILPNPGNLGYPYGNNHSRLQKFGTASQPYYLFYQSQWLERQFGYSGGYRNLHVNKIVVTESSAKIATLAANSATLKGAGQLTSGQINPYTDQSGAMMANGTKDWWMVRGVKFSGDLGPAKSLAVKTTGTGTLELHIGSLDSEPIATLTFSSLAEQETIVNLSEEISTFQSYIYFVWKDKHSDASVSSWKFYNQTAEEVASSVSDVYISGKNSNNAACYDLTGRKVTSPSKGIYIVNNKKVIY